MAGREGKGLDVVLGALMGVPTVTCQLLEMTMSSVIIFAISMSILEKPIVTCQI